MATLKEKIAAIQEVEATLRARVADLTNPATGESLSPGEAEVDPVGQAVYCNEGGTIRKHRLMTPVVAGA